MTLMLRERVLDALGSQLAIREMSQDALLVTLPLAFADGHLAQVHARRLSGETWTLSDRGQTAVSLSDAGVDLSTGAPSRSWNALLQSVDLPPAMEGQTDPYVLSMSSTRETLGTDLIRLGEAMLLGDGLRALRRPQSRRRLSTRILEVASDFPTLGVLPGAKMRTKFGVQREVTALLVHDNRHLYAQGLSRSGSSYDHARALFADSDVPLEERLVIVGQDTEVQSWQRDALSTVCRVTFEDQMAEAFREFAAA